MKTIVLIFALIPCWLIAQDNPFVYIDLEGKECTEKDHQYPLMDGVRVFCSNGFYGLKDQDGKILLYDEKFTYGKPIGHGISLFSDKKSKDYLFDKTGKPLACGDIDLATALEGYSTWGWVCKQIRVRFIDDKLLVKQNNKWGMINPEGKWIIDPIYDVLQDLKDPFYYIVKDGKAGLLFKETKKELLTKFEEIKPFSDGLAAVRLGEKWGYIDEAGELVISLKKVDKAGFFIEGLAMITDGDEKKWIDKTGKKQDIKNRDIGSDSRISACYDVLVSPNAFLYSRRTGKFVYTGNFAGEPLKSSHNWVRRGFDFPYALINTNGKIVNVDTVSSSKVTGFTDIFPIEVIKKGQYKERYIYVDTTGKRVFGKYVRAEDFDLRGIAKVIINRDTNLLKQFNQKQDEVFKKYIEEKQAQEKADIEAKEKALEQKQNEGKPCANCGGTGHLNATKKQCSVCRGEGGSICNSCGGSRFKYVTASDGKTSSQYCPSCNGKGKKYCYSCEGKGYTVDTNTPICPVCNGTGEK